MNKIMKNIKYFFKIFFHYFGFLCVALLFASICSRPTKTYNIDPPGMYFELQRKDSTVVILFGENEESRYANLIETSDVGATGGNPIYFIVENTSGKPRIRHIFFNVNWFFYEIHIPDYPYTIELNPLLKLDNFNSYVSKLPRIDMDSVQTLDYYVLYVYQASYDKGLWFRAYNLGDIDNMTAFIERFEKSNNFTQFSDLIKADISLDYNENTLNYGIPKETKRYTITKDNRKAMIRAGWLFIATMDISEGTVLEIDKWLVDDRKVLSVIYRIGPDGDRTPVNGALYPNVMERHKMRVFYK